MSHTMSISLRGHLTLNVSQLRFLMWNPNHMLSEVMVSLMLIMMWKEMLKEMLREEGFMLMKGEMMKCRVGGCPLNHVSLAAVGGIMVLCVTCLYPPVLTLRTDRCHYKPGILLLACFFDQIYRNPFSMSSKLWLLGHIIYRWKGIHEEIAAPLES